MTKPRPAPAGKPRMSDEAAPVRVAAPHACGGPGCYFCEWSNPTLEIPELEQRKE
jgi:hypothetical protein